MSLTIVLSGPKAAEPQARTALAAARFDVQPQTHDHGLAANDKGRQAITFITAHGENIDKAADAVRQLGWTLRMHYATPEPAVPNAEQRLADELAELRRELAELKAKVG
jgi:hypothetical protein